MYKRLLSLLLAFCLLWLPVGAARSQDAQLETIRALGILTGDDQGNLNLSAPVTRAQFVKMMVAASAYKDSVGTGYGAALFKDVKSGHWASGYIQLAVEQGWVTGYVDGTFRPENTITLEEACTALLRLLGYDSSSLSGTFPEAQLSKSAALGLLDDVDCSQGEKLTRQDCVGLFYNLLLASNSQGQVYATVLGYTVTNGELDYSALVSAGTKGPYVSTGGTPSLPFEAVTVYRNESLSTLSAMERYDVYYYNADMQTVWIYSNRVTGTLTAVSPNRTAPTAVTVAGASYTIGTSTAAYQLSSQGSFSDGELVTLLLGMNGEVVEVISAAESAGIYYGVVLSSTKEASSDSDSANVQVATVVACTDGSQRTFYHTGSALSAGRLVSVTTGSTGTTVKSLTSTRLSGKVSADGTKVGDYKLADGVEILDVDDEGGYLSLYPSRIAGITLSTSDVYFYTLNGRGEIDRLILNGVTGDTIDYCYITSAKTSNEGMNLSGTYQYLLDGESHTLSGSTIYGAGVGGAALIYEDGTFRSFQQLSKVTLTQLTSTYAMAENQKYQLADQVQVLLKDSQGNLYPTTLTSVNSEDYTLVGWYDDLGYIAGGRIRILVATPTER